MAYRPNRRTLLRIAGALTGASAFSVAASAGDESTHTYHEDDSCDSCDSDDGKTTVRTFACGQPEDDQWWESVLTVHNCTDCTRKLTLNTDGEIGTDEHEPDDEATGAISVSVGAGERTSLWFTGTVTRLDVEHADMNIGISLRCGDESTSSQCQRGYK